MDCSKASTYLQRFLSGDLKLKEARDYVRHIESCPSCRDDAEVYSMIRAADEAMRPGAEGNYDFSGLVEERIRKIRKELRRQKRYQFLVASMAGLLTAMLILILILYIGR